MTVKCIVSKYVVDEQLPKRYIQHRWLQVATTTKKQFFFFVILSLKICRLTQMIKIFTFHRIKEELTMKTKTIAGDLTYHILNVWEGD